MTADDVLDILESGGAGTKMVDLFAGPYPPTPVNLAGVTETGGFPADHVMGGGPGGAINERPRVQIMVRSTTYAAARNRAQQICSVLDGLSDQTVNGVFYHWAQAIGPPAYVGQDANGHHLFSANFDLLRDWSATS